MELTRRVTIAAPVERVGAALDDLAGTAHCVPGAGLSGRDGDRIEGVLRVKLGTVGLAFAGSGTYINRTLGGRGVLITGRGDDRRGNGAMAITVRATLEGDQTRTVITVKTELALTGRAGQFGHGMIADAHDRLVDQFGDRLSARLAAGLIGTEPARIESEPVATGAGPIGGGAQSGGASGVLGAPAGGPVTPDEVPPAPTTLPSRPAGGRRLAVVAVAVSVAVAAVAVRVVSRRR